ncbi:MAG: lipopolysaccharide heptosyltransferase II [Deltaproteobacteria bacterium]|nr:lipopolysaccharide heptosyltransferase II [Deltaproteobacteria bacterium]
MTQVIGKLPIQTTDIHRVFIRATNWIGDTVMSLPAMEAVRKIFPNAFIAVLARPWVLPLIEHLPAVDQIIPFQKKGGILGDVGDVIRISRRLRKMQFDLALLFQNAFEAALIAYLSGVKYRIGFNTDGRRFLLSHVICKDHDIRKQHQVEHYLAILRAMGWEAETKDPVVIINDKDMDTAHARLLSQGIKPDDRLIGLSPGAIFGPAKRWPAERFAVIGDWVVERWGAKTVLVGSTGEKDICKTVTRFMKNTAINLCGQTTLGEVMAVIKRCNLFITNDSGLMHVAAAMDVPTVAIFGSTDHVATGPRGRKARIVRHDLDCAPCLKRECPTHYECMRGIEPEEVWEEMQKEMSH